MTVVSWSTGALLLKASTLFLSWHLFPCDLNAALGQVMWPSPVLPSAPPPHMPVVTVTMKQVWVCVSSFSWHPQSDWAFTPEICNNSLLSSSDRNHSARPVSRSASCLASILHYPALSCIILHLLQPGLRLLHALTSEFLSEEKCIDAALVFKSDAKKIPLSICSFWVILGHWSEVV